MEEIAAAAGRVGNQIYTGKTHSEVMNRIAETRGADAAAIAQMFVSAEYGFLTTEARFVSRAEAFRIATLAKQVFENELADPDKNRAFFGSSEPRLDSSMVKRYSPVGQ